MNKRLVVALIVLAFGAGLGVGHLIWRGKGGGGETDEQLASDSIPDFPTPSEVKSEQTEKRVKLLIEMLASKNAAPPKPKDDESDIRFPKEYDKSLQIPVWLAAQALLLEDEQAIDILLQHNADDRYSLSVTAGLGNDYNMNVHAVCHAIVRAKILCIEDELSLITKDQLWMNSEIEESWAKDKHKGLCFVQIAAIDRALAFMRDADWKKARRIIPDAPVAPLKEFNEDREKNIKKLKAIRQLIILTKTPYRPTSPHRWFDHTFGLPWRGVSENK